MNIISMQTHGWYSMYIPIIYTQFIWKFIERNLRASTFITVIRISDNRIQLFWKLTLNLYWHDFRFINSIYFSLFLTINGMISIVFQPNTLHTQEKLKTSVLMLTRVIIFLFVSLFVSMRQVLSESQKKLARILSFSLKQAHFTNASIKARKVAPYT